MFQAILHPTRRSLALGLLGLLAGSPAVLAQSLPTDCAATPLVPTKVTLTWPDVPTECTVAKLPPSSLDLRVYNDSLATLQYRLIGHLMAGGERLRVALGTGALGPFGAATPSVDLDAMGVDIDDLAFSGSLFVEARSTDSAGGLIDRAFSPVIFFHKMDTPTGPKLFVYGREARRTQFNYGDLMYQLYTSTVPDPRLQGVFDGGAGIGNDRQGHGPELPLPPSIGGSAPGHRPVGPDSLTTPPMWEFCMRWIYQSIDSGFGEDHYKNGTLMKARGMRVVVDHINWATPKEFYASDNNGCFSFYSDENMGFRIAVFAEARLGGTDNVTIRAWDSLAAANINDPDEVPYWLFIANPGGLPRRVYYQNEPSELSNLMAFGSFVFHWVDSQTNPRLSGNRYLGLVSSTCQGGSCQDGNLVRMKPGDANRKFLVGHEVGHWLNRQWTDDDMGYDNGTWLANSVDPDCAFNGVGSHAMRSKEYSVAGFIEGFAHYMAALAWNDHTSSTGIFKYYKEVGDPAYADMEDDNWRVDLEGAGLSPLGGVSNWMANMCFVTDGHSVEMDWLRFFWDYRTSAGDQPSHFDIFELVAYTRDFHPWANNFGAFDSTFDAILDPALGQLSLVNRFVQYAVWNGVAQ